jgi:hypothetical protein
MEEKGLSLAKCRGQSYDGAHVMSGAYTGTQKRILEKQPSAKYVHCAAHNLNLVLNDAVCDVKEVSNFFACLQDLYSFGHSIRRWDLLQDMSGESEVTLKKLNPTRWAGSHMSLMGAMHRYHDVMKALGLVIL